jgi:hypothetical protein
MNAWLPQASYPCGNFSVTSSQNLSGLKGSIGHAFAVRIRTENQNQADFSPFSLREISVLSESTLGHLRCSLADVPPQPNSPSEYVLWVDQHRSALNPKRTVGTIRCNRVSRATLRVVVFHCCRSSHLFYTPQVTPQNQTRVKLNRVFFPRLFCQARSLGCGFARWRMGTVGISLIHSCASLIR